jgi:long-chain acyl-CoA synthetase
MKWDIKPNVAEPWLEHFPKETSRHLDYEEIPLDEILRRNGGKYAGCPSIYFEGMHMTYGELDRLVDRFATGLRRLGIREKDVVLIDMPNIPQFVICFFGILRAGGVPSPVMPLNRYAEIVHQADDSKARALIVLDVLYEEHLHGRDLSKIKDLEHVIMTGIGEYLPALKRVLGGLLGKIPRMKQWPDRVGSVRFHRFQGVLASGEPVDLPERHINVHEDAVCLIYTGGTTGSPKGVEITHFNLVANCLQGNMWVYSQLPELHNTEGKGGMVVVLPMAHSFGMSVGMVMGMYFGYKLILFPRPPEKISDMLAVFIRENATFCPGVPAIWNRINQDPDSPGYKGRLKNFTACLSAAAPLPLEVRREFERLTGARIIEGYGMSEASPMLTANPFGRSKANTVGFPVSDTCVKIVDIATGERILPQCPHGDPYCTQECGEAETKKYVGEICGAGPQIMKGYLDKPEETAHALRKDADGVVWYYTADIGCIDCEGYLRIKDRKRDMIKYKGHAVFPREVEDLMYQYEPILEVGVYGEKSDDPSLGEVIRAAVSLKPEFREKTTVEDISEWCKKNIAPFKYPRKIEIVDELPKSLVGKVLRRKLRDRKDGGEDS